MAERAAWQQRRCKKDAWIRLHFLRSRGQVEENKWIQMGKGRRIRHECWGRGGGGGDGWGSGNLRAARPIASCSSSCLALGKPRAAVADDRCVVHLPAPAPVPDLSNTLASISFDQLPHNTCEAPRVSTREVGGTQRLSRLQQAGRCTSSTQDGEKGELLP